MNIHGGQFVWPIGCGSRFSGPIWGIVEPNAFSCRKMFEVLGQFDEHPRPPRTNPDKNSMHAKFDGKAVKRTAWSGEATWDYGSGLDPQTCRSMDRWRDQCVDGCTQNRLGLTENQAMNG